MAIGAIPRNYILAVGESEWSAEFGLADLVRYYKPHNIDFLLGHLEKYDRGG